MPEFIDDRNTGVGGGSLSIQGLSSQGFRFLRCSNVVKHLGEVVADSPYSDDEPFDCQDAIDQEVVTASLVSGDDQEDGKS